MVYFFFRFLSLYVNFFTYYFSTVKWSIVCGVILTELILTMLEIKHGIFCFSDFFLCMLIFSLVISALSSGPSFVVSATLTISIFAGMQMFKHQLAATEYMTVLGGFIGSLFFIMLLTVSLNSWCVCDGTKLSGGIVFPLFSLWCYCYIFITVFFKSI